MTYIKGQDREQVTFLPDCIDDLIGQDNPVRVIDAFIDSLDMKGMGFKRPIPNITGRPPYDSRDLLKLYVYGYFNKIRSSRKLMAECSRNIELFFLLNRLIPDFRTISDFRKDNAKAIRNVFRAVEVQEQSVLSCFTLNEGGTVTCPMGNILSKTKMRGKNTIYGNKDACRQCPNRCTSSKQHKTVSFGPDTKYVPVRIYGNTKCKLNPIPENIPINPFNHALDRMDYITKTVILRIKKDIHKIKERMCLSEHPFGTVKWHHGAHYLLCKGKEKAAAELGLSFLAYNLKRAINMIGVQGLMAAF